MPWTDRKCPFRSDRGCRMAAEVAGLPINTCPVTDEQCKLCLNEWEPTPQNPGPTVASIARQAVSTHQPTRLRQFDARINPPIQQARPLSESDFPCVHRGDKLREHVCAPCRGGRTHSVHHCKLIGRECTPLASDAVGVDGKTVELCITCPSRQIRAREPERTIGYITTPLGTDAGPQWCNRFAGQSVFLVCGGPSLNQMDLSPLNQRGIMVAAVNNVAASHVRPHVWFGGDIASHFHQAIWSDPAIAKFTRHPHSNTRELRGDESIPGRPAKEYPNVWAYRTSRQNEVRPHEFLTLDAPPWPGQPRRSIMYPALRMLIDFGFTTIYLLGCDFKMEKGLAKEGESRGSYAFDEGKNQTACNSNNLMFASADAFLSNVNPFLKGIGVNVYNCSPITWMTAFEKLDFGEAIDRTLRDFPKVDSLFGYYWRAA